jgi:hypothetical protein
MISNTIILNTDTTIYTASKTVAILNIFFHCFGNVEEIITVYLVKSSESKGNINELYTIALPSKMNDALFDSNTKIILESGDSLICVGSVGGIANAHITYMEL